jgi:hypothetical protein
MMAPARGEARPDWSGLITCLQSQIGRCTDLRGSRTAQVEGFVVLSVAVRSGPFRTAVNGTLVARPSSMTPVSGRAAGFTSP